MTLRPGRLLATALVLLLAFQCARLIWVATKPLAPYGSWQFADPGANRPALVSALAGFDPFFRLTGGDGSPVAVTGLSLKLFGVRVDEAMGGGSAIIATPDGVQSSFGVGDEIVPGVKLVRVSIDNVTIDNGGREETLFLDQSVPANGANPASGGAGVPVDGAEPGGPSSQPGNPGASGTGAGISAAAFTTDIGFAPRLAGGRVSGFVVNPKGTGAAFNAIGLQPGDVLTAINGQPVRSVEDGIAAISDMPSGGDVKLQVERGGQVITLSTKASR